MFNYVSVIAGVGYIILGSFVMYFKQFAIELAPTVAYLLGGLMILYGVFRIIRALYRIRKSNQDE